jgi:hypothetical protein
MPRPKSTAALPLSIATDLDAATVADAHAALVTLLDTVESSERVAAIDLEAGTGPVTPLSLQLVVSATRAFPAARLKLGPNAAAALNALDPSKEN